MKEKAILIGIHEESDQHFQYAMKEMISLCDAIEIEIIGQMEQKSKSPWHVSYFGPGKIEELAQLVKETEAQLIVVNDDLSASQIITLEETTQVGVLDRTSLILAIFDVRAQSKEAKLQVEIAKNQYLLPRLLGSYESLGRQGGVGGAKNKGLGEKKMSLDKRRIEKEIQKLRRELKKVEAHRQTQSIARKNSALCKVALVGYTNAGKSTLMNAFLTLSKQDETKQVYKEDMLFATLDTATRRIEIDHHHPFLLSDTVGFVSSLPHLLIKAFQSTLQEVKEADLLLHVIDLSNAEMERQCEVSEETLKEIEAYEIPRLKVYTKADLVDSVPLPIDGILVSAQENRGIEELLQKIETCLYGKKTEATLLIPYEHGSVVSEIIQHYEVLSCVKEEHGTRIIIRCSDQGLRKVQAYQIESESKD